ncbi:Cu-binding protein [Geranomyces variabilis]|nr:Cu-binding protein [Geranomyces variabilis]
MNPIARIAARNLRGPRLAVWPRPQFSPIPQLQRRSYAQYAPTGSDATKKFSSMTWKSIGVFLLSGGGLYGYFQYEKQKLEERREAAKNEGAGKPLVGGPFSLVDHDGRPVTDLDYRGKFMLVYFGYTFCPDVCPEELEKMAEVVDTLTAKGYSQETVVPIFISCDPKRDSVEAIKEYVHDFHSKFVGLIGTHAQIKRVAKSYRLYFSAPPRAVDDDEADYLVDHSIFFYLIDPDGKYVAHFGRTDEAEEVAQRIMQQIKLRE